MISRDNIAIIQSQQEPINEEKVGEIEIEGKQYKNVRQFDSQGCYIINLIGNLSDNPMQEVIIQQYQKLNDDDIQVLEQIRRQQQEKESKCQHIIQIIGIQDNRKKSQLDKERKVYVIIEKGNYNPLNLIYQVKSLCHIQKLKLFEQMVQGVKELHDLGYFHRNLQPENFVFFQNQNKEYIIKLIDFGIVVNDCEINKTPQKDIFNYMAPEVAKFDTNHDKTADIWSLGTILYKILSKEDIIQAKNSEEQRYELCNLTQEWINEYINKAKDIKFFEKKLVINMLQIKNSDRIQLETLLKEIHLQLDELDQTKKQEKFKLQKRIQKQIQIEENKQKLDFEQKNQVEMDIMKRQLLQETKQSQIILLQLHLNIFTIFNQNLKYLLQKIIDIDTQDELKQLIIKQIENELQKNNKKINIYQQKQQHIQQIQTQEMQENILPTEIQCFITNDINFINEIIEQQIQLQKKIIDKQHVEQQSKEKEQQLNKEKEKYQQQFTIIKQQSNSNSNFYKESQQQVISEEYIQDVNILQLNITKYIQVLEQQEKTISKQEQLNQLIHYQAFNSILEELLWASSLKSSVEEKNKLDEQINCPQQEIFKSTSINQKYENEITKINNNIGEVSNQLNILRKLLNQQIFENYQQINEAYDLIQQCLLDFYQQHNQLYEQMKNSMMINLTNFQQDTNQQKNKQLKSLNNGNNDMVVEQFEEKLQKEEAIQMPQLQQVIENIQTDSVNEQQIEFNQLNNQLQNYFIQYQKDQQSFKLACVDIEFYLQMNDNKIKMEQQFQEQLKTLEEYKEIYLKNQILFQVKLDQIAKQRIKFKQAEDLTKKLQGNSLQKGIELQEVLARVKEKEKELKFMPLTNPINAYEELKIQEESLSQKLNKINNIKFDQQLNPSSFNQLKKQIIELISNINELTEKIPQNNEIQEFNNIYKQNQEQYNILFALVNYIKQYHLKRYLERIKKGSVDSQRNAIQEQEVQVEFKRYQNFLFQNGNQITIETMVMNQKQMDKEIQEKENYLKSFNLDILKKNIKDNQKINEIINNKKYYKIIEFTQMLILNINMQQTQN